MGLGANVLAIRALEELRSSLINFGADARDALREMVREVQRTQEFLERAEGRWLKEFRRREEIARWARQALAACQSSAYRDANGNVHIPDCSAQERALIEARSRVADAQEALRQVRQWIAQVQQAVGEYEKEAWRLISILDGELPKATALLENKISVLNSYVMMTPPAGESISSATGEDVPAVTLSPSVPASVERTVEESPAAVSPPQASIPSSDPFGEVRTFRIPEPEQLKGMEHVTGPEGFQKTSYEEMVKGFRKLEEVVRPAVDRGLGKEYFEALDERLGLSYPRSYTRVYDAFYGHDSIRIEKVGDVFYVTNGAHRLWTAMKLGVKEVPARIIFVK